MMVSRRALLAGFCGLGASSALAEAPLTSLRPIARIDGPAMAARQIALSGLTGTHGFAIADVETGEVLDAHAADIPQPPASVTKAVTALYAIESLGPSHRFATRVFAEGPINDGKLDGNLILAGGGDPNLLTDHLANLAASLKETGLREVTGEFQVWDNALINLDEIDHTQLDHVGYNPTVTGLNLNFNRVHFEWKLSGGEYTTTMDARSEQYRPLVTSSRIDVVDRSVPVFTYQNSGSVDRWTVARDALNNAGSRWLPVRHPAIYTGEVFASFARSHGIVLKSPKEISAMPEAQLLVTHLGDPLTEVMRDMLRYSTNLTAEAAGMAATQALTGELRGLRTSALGMARWADRRCGGISPSFVDHSGLGDTSRISAADMVRLLSSPGVREMLQPIMKVIPFTDADRKPLANQPGLVTAKTGTLNFVSSLAGYLRSKSGRNLAFAFFGADLEARALGKLSGDETPRGSVAWARSARSLQNQILRGWAVT